MTDFSSNSHLIHGKKVGSAGKKSACNAEDTGDTGLIPGSGRSPGGGHGNPLQYSCLENPVDRGALWAAVERVIRSQIQLMTKHSTCTYTCDRKYFYPSNDYWDSSFNTFFLVKYKMGVLHIGEKSQKYVDGITSQGKNVETASFIQKWFSSCFPINF